MNRALHRIALVENDLPTNRAFARLLRAHGFTVESYVSAEALLTRNEPSALACLLLDIDLDGMSGLDLQSHLQLQGDFTPVIFITGRHSPAAHQRAERLGCCAFLHKPVKALDLFDAIGRALTAAPLTPAASP